MSEKIFITDINTESDLAVFLQNNLNKNYIKYLIAAECIKQKPQNKQQANAILKEVEQKFNKYSINNNHISKRKIALLDKDFFENIKPNELKLPELFSNFYSNVNGVGINKKMKFYEDKVLEYCRKYITKKADEIVNVTCTGVSSPNPIQKYISEKGWETGLTNCFFSDCYASIVALKSASGLLHNPSIKPVNSVNVIHSELLSMHVNAKDLSAENLVVMSLFGDGFANYFVKKEAEKGIEIKFIKEKLIANSSEHMKWQLDERIFKMTLSPMVPFLLDENILPFVKELATESKIEFNDLVENSIWAIHPGGPKIVQMVADKLKLNNEQVKYSYKVLKENGNITSATMPFMWQYIINDEKIPTKKRIVSLAFGPGLTACAMIGEKV